MEQFAKRYVEWARAHPLTYVIGGTIILLGLTFLGLR